MDTGRVENNRLLRVGIVGSVLAAVCCFTPVLVALLGVLGLSSIVAYLDFVLFPFLALFLAVTAVALWRRKNLK